jgi:hypothetical protein
METPPLFVPCAAIGRGGFVIIDGTLDDDDHCTHPQPTRTAVKLATSDDVCDRCGEEHHRELWRLTWTCVCPHVFSVVYSPPPLWIGICGPDKLGCFSCDYICDWFGFELRPENDAAGRNYVKSGNLLLESAYGGGFKLMAETENASVVAANYYTAKREYRLAMFALRYTIKNILRTCEYIDQRMCCDPPL